MCLKRIVDFAKPRDISSEEIDTIRVTPLNAMEEADVKDGKGFQPVETEEKAVNIGFVPLDRRQLLVSSEYPSALLNDLHLCSLLLLLTVSQCFIPWFLPTMAHIKL